MHNTYELEKSNLALDKLIKNNRQSLIDMQKGLKTPQLPHDPTKNK